MNKSSSSLRAELRDQLRLPVIAAPMFLASGPDLLLAQCKAGVLGSMPSRSVRTAEDLQPTLRAIKSELAQAAATGMAVAPFAINLVVHKSNPRFAGDLEVCLSEQVPFLITSLGPSREIVKRAHAYGGRVLHDVTNMKHARKAIAEGVDGLILVCAGAGGHAGVINPFALVRELRAEYDGFIAVAGAISDGYGIAAAIAMGADAAYIGTRFIATLESGVGDDYRRALVDSGSDQIIYTPWLSGIPANFLRPSFVACGLDPDNLPPRETAEIRTTTDGRKKSWQDIWAAGQGVGSIKQVLATQDLIDQMTCEYAAARERLSTWPLGSTRPASTNHRSSTGE